MCTSLDDFEIRALNARLSTVEMSVFSKTVIHNYEPNTITDFYYRISVNLGYIFENEMQKRISKLQ